MSNTVNSPSCQVCLSGSVSSLGRRSELVSIDGYAPYVSSLVPYDRPIYKCKTCGMQFIHPPYDEVEAAGLYGVSGYQLFVDHTVPVTEFSSPKGRSYLEKLKADAIAAGYSSWGEEFRKTHRRKPVFLDIGCGRGAHLWVFDQLGFDVVGMDLSQANVDFVKKELNYEVIHSSLEDFDGGSRYDMLWASHVIEHVASPHEFMKHLLRVAADDCLIALHTPHTNDMTKETERYRDIYHTLFFDPFTLGLLASMHGLRCIGGGHEYLDVGANVINFSMSFVRDQRKDQDISSNLIRVLRASYDPVNTEFLRLV